MEKHPNNVVRAIFSLGYNWDDLLPAYPGKGKEYVDAVLTDCSLALNRPVQKYGILGVAPATSKYFNILELGNRGHGSEIRTPQFSKNSSAMKIFLFGGSTTVGFGVEDCETISSHLQRLVDPTAQKVQFFNFGRGSYTSREEALWFLDLLERGIVPDVAVFLDGLNDSFYAYGNHILVEVLNELYQGEKARRGQGIIRSILDYACYAYRFRKNNMPSSQTYRPERNYHNLVPYVSEAAINDALSKSHRSASELPLNDFCTELGQKVWGNYCNSMAVITSLARRYSVKTLFLWQPVPYIETRAEQRILPKLFPFYRYEVFTSYVYRWARQNVFPNLSSILKDPTKEFVDLMSVGRGCSDVGYVDICHYSGSLSKVIAEQIHSHLDKHYFEGEVCV